MTVVFDKETYKVYGQIHTHPLPDDDPQYNVKDQALSRKFKIPFYNIYLGRIRNAYGKGFGKIDSPSSKLFKN